MRIRQVFLIALCLSAVFASISGQRVTSPESFTNGRYLDQFTQHHELVDYFRHTAENSDQVKLIEYGRTNQNRPLILAFVSSADNLRQLDKIRLNHLAGAGLADGQGDPGLERAIVWLSFGVHGNEAGASESSLNVLYRLATGNTGKIKTWLDSTIVIIDPCINPDGYNRYVQWYLNHSGSSANPRPEAVEHSEPWPGGRVNHYLHDLNRDWAWASQVETRARLVQYKRWMPHVHADYHEQYPNDPYYFAPAAEPFHLYISDWQREFQDALGRNNARYFDENKWLYFTREYFDLFYPSYGDTYPTFNGAIGMTYEQAGHGVAGRAYLLENGDTLTIRDRVEHHTATALSTIEVATRLKENLTSGFDDFFERSRKNGFADHKHYAIKTSRDRSGQWDQLRLLLDLHGIEYYSVSDSVKTSAYSFREMENVTVVIDSGDVFLPGTQARSLLLHILFEPESELVDSATYDITAWSLPFAYGLDAYALTQDVPFKNYQAADPPSKEKMDDPYAFIFEKRDWQDMAGVIALQKEGIVVRYSTRDLKIDGKLFDKGCFIVTITDNDRVRDLSKKVSRLGIEYDFQPIPVSTGFGDVPPDLGSDKVRIIENIRILVPTGDGVSVNDYGQLWQFLDTRLKANYTAVRTDDLLNVNWDDYNCMILPSGSYGSLRSEAAMDKLKEWMKSGGRIIAIGASIQLFEGEDGLDFDTWSSEEAKSEHESSVEEIKESQKLSPYGDQLREGLKDHVPGAIVRLKLDTTHPLAFGLGSHYFCLRTSGRTYEHLTGAQNVGYSVDKLEYVGFIGSRVRKKMNNASGLFVIPHGSGNFIALVDNPIYRSFWEQGYMLLSNAIFLQ